VCRCDPIPLTILELHHRIDELHSRLVFEIRAEHERKLHRLQCSLNRTTDPGERLRLRLAQDREQVAFAQLDVQAEIQRLLK